MRTSAHCCTTPSSVGRLPGRPAAAVARALRHTALLLLLASCALLPACGGDSGPPPGGGGGSPVPGDDSVAWGFFAYTNDFIGGLRNARLGRATGVLWQEIERSPGSGSYEWGDLDARIGNAQGAGMNVVLVLKTGNGSFSEPGCRSAVDRAGGIATGDQLASCPLRAEMEGAWGRMVTALVERYDGDRQRDMPGLDGSIRVDIQIENEAANSQYWDYGESDRAQAAERYLRLLEISYQAKEAANPSTQVILAGLIHPNSLARCDGGGCSRFLVQNVAFTKRVLGRPAVFDAVDVHFFAYYRFEPSFVDAGWQWVADQMQQRGYQRPVYSLEWTGAMMLHVNEGYTDEFTRYFPDGRAFPTTEAFEAMYRGLDRPENASRRQWFEAEQAKEFAKLFTNLLAVGVRRLVHVQYADFSNRPGAWDNPWWNWQGVVKYVGGAPIRKPSYYTYNVLSERLHGFTAARRVDLQRGDVRLYEFTFPTRRATYVLWSDGPEVAVDLSRVAGRDTVRVTSIVTELGPSNEAVVPPEQTTSAGAVPAGDRPVLIETVG